MNWEKSNQMHFIQHSSCKFSHSQLTCSWEITALVTKCCSCSLAKLIQSCSKLFTPRSYSHRQRNMLHTTKKMHGWIIVTGWCQPQNRRCPLFPRCCPSLWDSTSHWSAPATSQTAPSTRLWQWHLCNGQHNPPPPDTPQIIFIFCYF